MVDKYGVLLYSIHNETENMVRYMAKAMNAVLTKGSYTDGWMTFSIKRKDDVATVYQNEGDKTQVWDSIPIVLADDLYTKALASGYEVAF